MVVVCEICNKEFKYKSYLIKHLNNKKKCQVIETPQKVTETSQEHKCKFCMKNFQKYQYLLKHLSKNQCKLQHNNIRIYEIELGIEYNEEEKLVCRYCNKTFASAWHKTRHVELYCKEKEIYEAELEQKVLKARSTKNMQSEFIPPPPTTNNIATQNINNTININLPPIRAFGDENIDYITIKQLLKELKKVKDVSDLAPMIASFTKLIHANPAHPENHNVQITSINAAYGRVFNGIQFENEDVTTIQDKILTKIGETVIEKAEIEQVDQAIGFNNRERILEAIDDGKKSKKYKQKVRSVLYNNKSTISQTELARNELE